MKVAQIKFTSWGKIQYYQSQDLALKPGDYVIAQVNGAEEIGFFVGYLDINEKEVKLEEAAPGHNGEENNGTEANGKNVIVYKGLIRKTTPEDREKMPAKEEKNKVIKDCERFIKNHNLEMKLIDAHFSFDRTKITFAFAAEGRVDFRALVRDLTSHFNCIIRLHQIGKRDEAKVIGDCGPCGRPLCCRRFIRDFTSITSKMAETQQVVHRGSERISGMCGRLKCCLEYEQEGYKKLAANLPAIGEVIEVEGNKGTVINCNILKQTIDVKVNGNNGETNIIEVDAHTRESTQTSK